MKARFLIILFAFIATLMFASVSQAQGWGDQGSGWENKDNKTDDGRGSGQWGQRVQQRLHPDRDSGPEDGRPGPGMGPDGGGMMGGRNGMGRGMFGPPMTTEELMAFLNQYDATKAKQFNEMYLNQPEQFGEYVGMVCELYTPAARIMENDPEAGKLAVKNTSLTIDIKKMVADYKISTDESVKTKLKAALSVSLNEQFDVVIESQQKEIQAWQERLDRFESRMQSNSDGNGNTAMEQNRGNRGSRGSRFDRFANMQERMKKEVERRIEDIAKWKEQKKQIVERQLTDLVEDVRPFPWAN